MDRICENCKHAVYGAIGNYCSIDKHGVKSSDKCSIGQFKEILTKEETSRPRRVISAQIRHITIGGVEYNPMFTSFMEHFTIHLAQSLNIPVEQLLEEHS